MAICGLLDFRHIIASVFLPQRPHIEEPNIDPSPASNIPHTPVLSPEYMMPSSCRSFGPEPIRDQPPNTELEQQQQQQQAMSKPSTLSPASLPALAILVKGALAPLFKTTDPYLSPAYLENHRIKVRRLDFESGVTLDRAGRKADPYAKKYTQIVPSHKMEKAVGKTRPWISPHYGTVRSLVWDESLDNWWHAYVI